MLVKRASFLESEAAAASHPNRTYFMPVASHAATISRCTRELRDAKGDAARCRELRRERAAARVRAADVDGALHDYSKALASIEAEAHFEQERPRPTLWLLESGHPERHAAARCGVLGS